MKGEFLDPGGIDRRSLQLQVQIIIVEDFLRFLLVLEDHLNRKNEARIAGLGYLVRRLLDHSFRLRKAFMQLEHNSFDEMLGATALRTTDKHSPIVRKSLRRLFGTDARLVPNLQPDLDTLCRHLRCLSNSN